MKRFLSLALMFSLIAACASSGEEGPNNAGDDTAQVVAAGRRLLVMRMTVNPNAVVDTSGQGFYIFLINSQGQPIEATDFDTFTDFVRFDGQNFDWYNRQANLPNVGFNFVQAGSLNASSRITPDGKTVEVVLDTGESTSFVNQFVVGSTFTAHAITSDNFQGAVIGRLIDTLGPGPNINSNSAQTVLVRKGEGAVSPLPQSYPTDPINDFVTQGGLPANYPFLNFDIVRFEITAQ